MSEQPPAMHDAPGRDEGTRPESEMTTAGMPRWVKIFWAVAIVVVLLVVILLLAGGGKHGPMRHGLDQSTTGGYQ